MILMVSAGWDRRNDRRHLRKLFSQDYSFPDSHAVRAELKRLHEDHCTLRSGDARLLDIKRVHPPWCALSGRHVAGDR